ncbi:uncharacterized protein si:ch211-198p11.6 isoform X2 [Toxotes jaculatrix]|uniref:uncharacterized protein si:ch211-198p11.6 isoform X2 n=1 Tax=Toxotes jaculatrix TaxID=941984 RepID=UPI001B3A8743|nr:uncharacterized protein si:ch211-198p11.6 isoform X2 [Toxotes jaculatrix]
MSSHQETVQVLHIWELALPLPAVLIITDRCSSECGDCCPNISICEQCFRLAEMCDCRLPTMRSCLTNSCPSPTCVKWDCACTCQPPECESCNCLCFEIRIK